MKSSVFFGVLVGVVSLCTGASIGVEPASPHDIMAWSPQLQWYSYSVFATWLILSHNFSSYLELQGGVRELFANGRFQAMAAFVEGRGGKIVRANPVSTGSWANSSWDLIVIDGGQGPSQLTFLEKALLRLNAGGMAIFLTPCHPANYVGLCITVWSTMLQILSRARREYEFAVCNYDHTYMVVLKRRHQEEEATLDVDGSDIDSWKAAILQPISPLEMFQWLAIHSKRGLVWGERIEADITFSLPDGTQRHDMLVVERHERIQDAMKRSFLQHSISESIQGETAQRYMLELRRSGLRTYEPVLASSASFAYLMSHAHFLRWLIQSHSHSSLLVIGCENDDNFAALKNLAKLTVCADLRLGGIHPMTLDEFFAQPTADLPPMWDLVFIDGHRQAKQVLKYVDIVLSRLSPEGAIVLRNCNPTMAILEDRQWNGDVWKAVAQLRTRLDLDIAVGDIDQGCGVIKKRQNTAVLEGNWNIDGATYADLDLHRITILRLLPLTDLMAWEANAEMGTISSQQEPFPSIPTDHGAQSVDVPDFVRFQRQYEADHGTLLPQLHKWKSYFSAYDEQFSRFRGRERVNFVEVGVQSGGSVLFWRWYFGAGLRYIGIDINPAAQQFGAPWAEIVIGDAGDPAFWSHFTANYERPDIFLDDGGHTMVQQIASFNGALSWVAPGGIFATEDLHTSYWEAYGGRAPAGPSSPADSPSWTFMDHIKSWLDWIHVFRWARNFQDPEYSGENPDAVFSFFEQVESIHIHESIVFLRKYGKDAGAKLVDIHGGSYTVPYQDDMRSWEPYDWCSLGHPFDFCSADSTETCSNAH